MYFIARPRRARPANSQPSLGGFQLAGPGNGNNNGLTSSPRGGAYVAFDSDPAFAGAFSQTIAGLTIGDGYTLSFYAGGAQEIFGGAPDTTRSITATLGNETFSTPVIDTPSQGFSPWQLFSTTFTYTGGGDVLSFLANGGPGGAPPYALLDGVSLTSTTGGTPEPSTWVMIVAGFAGLGLAARATQVESNPRLTETNFGNRDARRRPKVGGASFARAELLAANDARAFCTVRLTLRLVRCSPSRSS